MRAHTVLRLAHVLREEKESWPEVVSASLRELSEAQGKVWGWSRNEICRYLDLADCLFDMASENTGRARAALRTAAEAVAELEMQHRDVLRLTHHADHVG
jgi:hypothetical protein